MTPTELIRVAEEIWRIEAQMDDDNPEDRAVCVILDAVIDVLKRRAAREARGADR